MPDPVGSFTNWISSLLLDLFPKLLLHSKTVLIGYVTLHFQCDVVLKEQKQPSLNLPSGQSDAPCHRVQFKSYREEPRPTNSALRDA